MERKTYAVCPRCGRRAEITKIIWDWDGEQDIALIKCVCGRSQLPYLESRILHIDLHNPYMKEAHFDLLVPPGWDDSMWSKVSACLQKY